MPLAIQRLLSDSRKQRREYAVNCREMLCQRADM